MPKIIGDLKIKILNNALELFCRGSYKEVNMKSIAKSTGIAVGTLYNYYSNKKEIFVDAFNMSWNKTFNRLDALNEIHMSPRERLDYFLETLYKEMENRKGLGGELLKIDAFEALKETGENDTTRIKRKIFERLDIIIASLKADEGIYIKKEYELRLKKNIIHYIIAIITETPKEKDENIEYLKYLVNSILR